MTETKGVALAMALLVAFGWLSGGEASWAAAPDPLGRFPEDSVQSGAGAAQLNNPRGVAGDPSTGHVYVSDLSNSRMSEYTAWGLFVKSWGWGVEDGSAELQTCGPAEPEGTPDPSLCQAGSSGAGRGQFHLPSGLAVDPAGNVYVYEIGLSGAGNRRVQKFSPDGEFLLMFGGDVNKTKVEALAPQAQRDVCPIDPDDECGAGTAGTGPSQLAASGRDFIAYNPALDAIVVGGTDRIQIFNLDGVFREEIDFEGPLAVFDGKTVQSLDVDTAGNIYLAIGGLPDVYKLSPTGEPLAPGKPAEGSSFDVDAPAAVTVDAQGQVFAIDGDRYVVGFDSSGGAIEGAEASDEFAREGARSDSSATDLTVLASNMCSGSAGPNLYVGHFGFATASYVSAFGPGPVGCEDPPPRPPDILEQFATAVGTDGATVKARINPRFWNDTRYYVEYGTSPCSAGGCGKFQPAKPGALLTDKSVSATLTTAGVLLQGLAPNTTYHFRFVAESSGGGPVYGIDPDGKEGPKEPTEADGLEGTFTTFAVPGGPDSCVNAATRGGASARLPDCRAYELVSPPQKGDTDIGLLREGRYTEMNVAATSGDRFTFSSIASFVDPDSGAYISQYLAERGAAGWGAENISPRRTTPPLDSEPALTNEYKGFTPDLCLGWLRHNSAATLTPDGLPKYPNIYRRANCADPPAYTAITTEDEKPSSLDPPEYSNLALDGFSEDGTHALYVIDDKVHKDAPAVAPQELLLYERVEDQTRFVCVLPNGKATKPCAAGTNGLANVDLSSMHNAISADGSKIFWTTYKSGPSFTRPGTLYVRIDGKETVPISAPVTSSPAFFWTAANDGSKAIFEIVEGELKGDLYQFDTATKSAQPIAQGVEGPLGASEDASVIYLVSTKALAVGGTDGAHNLYRYEAGSGGGTFTFIAELAGRDIGVGGGIKLNGPPTPIHRQPAGRWASVSADGRYAAFTSAMAPPSGYDNRDAATGEAAAEVYRYDSTTNDLHCVSCNPTGARPTSANLGTSPDPRPAAARLPGWEIYFHSPRVLSADGQRIFFESFEALVPRDTNGAWDVYQWEAPGKGSCDKGDLTFHAQNGGCVELISSGKSAADSEFLDADLSGQSAFIATQASLVGSDYGLNDIYVARVGGGFPEPPVEAECEGEACQAPPSPPSATTPGSLTHEGPANPKPQARRCPKGKRKVRLKGRVRCVKKRKARATKRRRAAR